MTPSHKPTTSHTHGADCALTASALFPLKHCPPLTVQGSAYRKHSSLLQVITFSKANITSRLILMRVQSVQQVVQRTPPCHPAPAPLSSAICCWTAPLWHQIGITSSEHDVGGVQRQTLTDICCRCQKRWHFYDTSSDSQKDVIRSNKCDKCVILDKKQQSN